MVISEQVQYAVNQQLVKPFARGDFGVIGLSGARIHGNDNISKQIGLNVRMVSLPHGKSDYIGRACALKIRVVQFGHSPVIYNQYRKFTFGAVQGV